MVSFYWFLGGGMGPFWPGGRPFWAVGEGGVWVVSKVQSLARGDPPRFILLISYRDTLLVVSIFSILVYDCHVRPLLQS